MFPVAAVPPSHSPFFSIRQGTPKDAFATWKVLKAAVTPLIGRPYSRDQVDAWIDDEWGSSISAHTMLVAESQGRIIGFARFNGEELEALYVHPDEAGHRVGELLLASVEQAASARHVGTLHLDAALNAVPFYQAAGYQAVGQSMPRFDNGVALPCLRMQKKIGWKIVSRPRLARRPRPEPWAARAGCCKVSRG